MPILASLVLTAALAAPPATPPTVMPAAASPPAATPPDCPLGTRPLQAIAPVLPRRSGNAFSGRVVLAFDILPSGEVDAPTIVSSSWQPVGRSRGEPEGYEAAILAAIAQWRYPPQAAACRKAQPLEFAHE